MKNIEWRREHRLPLTKKLNYSAPTINFLTSGASGNPPMKSGEIRSRIFSLRSSTT